MAYTAGVIAPVNELLLGELSLASFRLPDADVWQIELPALSTGAAVTITLWPSIRRVDVSSQGLTIVFTEVAGVELVERVEVLFRRENGDYLVVAIGGKVIVRA